MRFDLTIKVQSRLLSKEEVLSGQSTPRPQADRDEPQGIQQEIEYGQQHVGQEIEFRHQGQDRIPGPCRHFTVWIGASGIIADDNRDLPSVPI
jgi:hypothetical protein